MENPFEPVDEAGVSHVATEWSRGIASGIGWMLAIVIANQIRWQLFPFLYSVFGGFNDYGLPVMMSVTGLVFAGLGVVGPWKISAPLPDIRFGEPPDYYRTLRGMTRGLIVINAIIRAGAALVWSGILGTAGAADWFVLPALFGLATTLAETALLFSIATLAGARNLTGWFIAIGAAELIAGVLPLAGFTFALGTTRFLVTLPWLIALWMLRRHMTEWRPQPR